MKVGENELKYTIQKQHEIINASINIYNRLGSNIIMHILNITLVLNHTVY